jgi:hypothetical protein
MHFIHQFDLNIDPEFLYTQEPLTIDEICKVAKKDFDREYVPENYKHFDQYITENLHRELRTELVLNFNHINVYSEMYPNEDNKVSRSIHKNYALIGYITYRKQLYDKECAKQKIINDSITEKQKIQEEKDRKCKMLINVCKDVTLYFSTASVILLSAYVFTYL